MLYIYIATKLDNEKKKNEKREPLNVDLKFCKANNYFISFERKMLTWFIKETALISNILTETFVVDRTCRLCATEWLYITLN